MAAFNGGLSPLSSPWKVSICNRGSVELRSLLGPFLNCPNFRDIVSDRQSLVRDSSDQVIVQPCECLTFNVLRYTMLR